jgi:threonine efflux protein
MWNDLFLVYCAYAIAAGSPGPSTMAIMGAAMRQGRTSAAALAAGVVTMSFTWGLVAATGLSALLMRYAQALTILKIAGGLYLLWLAVKSARAALYEEDPFMQVPTARVGHRALYRRGVLMHLGNPKAVLSWLALMSLGVGPNATAQHIALAFGGCVLLGALIFFGYALLFSTEPMVRGYARARRWIEGALGLVFAGAGLRLIFSR